MKNFPEYRFVRKTDRCVLSFFLLSLSCFCGVPAINAVGQEFQAVSVEGRLDEINTSIFFDLIDFNTGARESFEVFGSVQNISADPGRIVPFNEFFSANRSVRADWVFDGGTSIDVFNLSLIHI